MQIQSHTHTLKLHTIKSIGGGHINRERLCFYICYDFDRYEQNFPWFLRPYASSTELAQVKTERHDEPPVRNTVHQ